MVNVRLGSFNDFLKAVQGAPKSVQQILYKAYPEYAQQLNQYYNTLFNNQQALPGNTPKQISGPTIKEASKEVAKVIPKASPLLKGLGKVAGKVVPAIAAIGEVSNILNPNDPIKNKALSVGGIAGLLTGHPYLGTAALLGAGLNRGSAKAANAIADRNYDKWDKQYGVNSPQYDPRFIKHTPEEIKAGYTQKELVNQLAKDKKEEKQLKEQLQTEQQLTDVARENYNNALQNYQDVVMAFNPSPTPNPSPNTEVPKTQLFPNGLSRDLPETQEGGIPPIPVQLNQSTNQQGLTPQQMASTLTSNDLRNASIQNLDTLNNMGTNNNNQQQYDINQYTPFLQQYADLAAQQRLQQQAQNEAILKQYADIMDRYQEAINKDRQYQALQSMADSFSNIGSGYQGPVQFIGPQGQMYTINNQQAQQNALLRQARAQQNATPNTDRFKNMLAIEQMKAKDPRLQTTPDNTMKNLMEAQLLGQTFNVNPALFLGSNAEKLIDILGKDRNEYNKTEYERSLLGSQALKEITVDQSQTANQMVRDKAMADSSLLNTAYVQGKLDERQYKQLLADQAKFNAQMQADINLLQMKGAQDRDLINYRIMAEAKNPLNALKYGLDYQSNAGYFPSGQDASNALNTGIQYYNTIMGLGNNTTPPLVNNSQGGKFTPQEIATMMRYRRNK